jgi:hypothetical protein
VQGQDRDLAHKCLSMPLLLVASLCPFSVRAMFYAGRNARTCGTDPTRDSHPPGQGHPQTCVSACSLVGKPAVTGRHGAIYKGCEDSG